MICSQWNLAFEYIGEFETEFDNVLEYGCQVGSVDGKNQR